jgi:hypothetical protein
MNVEKAAVIAVKNKKIGDMPKPCGKLDGTVPEPSMEDVRTS